MKIYGLKNCDTCRKALKSLSSAELVDIRTTPMPIELLTRAHAQFGADLVNRRSTTWRNLEQSERSRPELELLATHPALMKRPLIETSDGSLYLGWAANVQAALI
ncbi:arsenate reductase [Lutimaribacter sp. EGI FJ00015]|uniref:Arsenate reductase n=1 Tax=Lutimaribacter degradans TaxID=2945989 RepID=A0ACC5ZRS7_9RHOB|nr:ArsC/Spx/MgsR family protein [Lutimaribacter sp. EGI FJ00013]MCM2560555.1 arsenate reductase [Lutimaribacter sp. EGI FJ00013]MCO0612502.1 arsenate reductase [Lutimaribacter sp. EGI FJ00015]MCO0634379.1 arsenate reductase [Lutimaribacter sp. EGI FJ00014]